jgi:ribosome-associated protein
MIRTILDVLEEKKGEEILLLDVRGVASFTDYFILCTGTSDRMLDALADAVIREVRKVHRKKSRVEGEPRDGWLLIDYDDIVVHLFSPDQREYYRLEDLWSEGKVLIHMQ